MVCSKGLNKSFPPLLTLLVTCVAGASCVSTGKVCTAKELLLSRKPCAYPMNIWRQVSSWPNTLHRDVLWEIPVCDPRPPPEDSWHRTMRASRAVHGNSGREKLPKSAYTSSIFSSHMDCSHLLRIIRFWMSKTFSTSWRIEENISMYECMGKMS